MKTKIYVGKATGSRPAVRPELVKLVKKTYRNPRYRKVRKHIKLISITKSITSGRDIIGGQFCALDAKVSIRDHSAFDVEDYGNTIIHEFAHARYHFAFKYNKEAFLKFEEVALKHAPISEYVEDYEKHFRKVKNRDLRVITVFLIHCAVHHYTLLLNLYFSLS